jgi:dethiobiotin synthetase
VQRIVDLDALHDLVLVEGAGGLVVPFTAGDESWTLIDLAAALHAPVMVVTSAGLGTLNHTALTVDRLREESISLAGIVIGSWPAEPDLATRCNLADLAEMTPARSLAGVLPARMAAMRDFRKQARAALAPRFGGTFRSSAFVAAHRP